MIADISLAHSTANVKGHGRNHVLGSLTGQHNTADLRAVSVNDGQLMAAGNQLCDIFAGLLDNFQLGFRGRGTVLGLQGISAQSNNEFGHGKFLL